jgi:pimeloyl-ACP methyl ester carboxylesterase
MDESLRTDPHALTGAPSPRMGRWPVNGTTLYAEVRGSGPAILLIPGGAEDAEGWRPVAERLAGHTVVTYDRRGTLRSGREEWPGRGSAQHADDAAGLLRTLDLGEVAVFGGSSAGIIAVQLALRYPDLVRLALAYEPGYFRVVGRGAAFQEPANAAVRAHLAEHPRDWVGAYAAFGATVAETSPSPAGGPLTPPAGMEWYDRREEVNAEPLVRDDILILTTEILDETALAASEVEVCFAYGTGSVAMFREIAAHLAGVRGEVADAIEGVGHVLYFHPDVAAAYIDSRARRSGDPEIA